MFQQISEIKTSHYQSHLNRTLRQSYPGQGPSPGYGGPGPGPSPSSCSGISLTSCSCRKCKDKKFLKDVVFPVRPDHRDRKEKMVTMVHPEHQEFLVCPACLLLDRASKALPHRAMYNLTEINANFEIGINYLILITALSSWSTGSFGTIGTSG